MRTIIIRMGVVIIAVLLQISFFNMALLGGLTVDLLPLIALAWVIIVGFEKIWIWIVVLGIFADLFLFERIGVNVIFFILIAYMISFFSRRFLIEKKLAGITVIVLFVIIAFLFLDMGRILFIEKFSVTQSYIAIKENIFSWQRIVSQNILNILFFYVVYLPLNKIEKNIKRYENRINIM